MTAGSNAGSDGAAEPIGDPNFGPPRWPGDTRPPFAPGNRMAEGASVTHGAWTGRKVEPIAARFRETFTATAPWATAPAFAGTVASWAHAEAQATLLRDWLDEHGIFDNEGEERPAVRTLDRVEGRLAKLRDQLGLNPQALGKLLATAATVARATDDHEGLAALHAEGARILASRAVGTLPASDSTRTDPAQIPAVIEEPTP